jgi:hypothetical protein
VVTSRTRCSIFTITKCPWWSRRGRAKPRALCNGGLFAVENVSYGKETRTVVGRIVNNVEPVGGQ